MSVSTLVIVAVNNIPSNFRKSLMDLVHFIYEKYLRMTSVLKDGEKKTAQTMPVFITKLSIDFYIVQTDSTARTKPKPYFILIHAVICEFQRSRLSAGGLDLFQYSKYGEVNKTRLYCCTSFRNNLQGTS
jgi:hypothetical protein